jgi:hypothetical protein
LASFTIVGDAIRHGLHVLADHLVDAGYLLRRLRQRTRGADTTHNQYVLVRQHLRAAIGFLDWLAAQGLSLADARQGDLDEWIASDNATLRGKPGASCDGPTARNSPHSTRRTP